MATRTKLAGTVQQLAALPAGDALSMGGDVVELTNENYTVQPEDGVLLLTHTAGADNLITFPATGFRKGKRISILMPAAASSNDYDTDGLSPGELVFDAALDNAEVMFTGSAWAVLVNGVA